MYKQLRKKGRSDKEPRHVRLYHVMMKTAAWKSLSANARAIYVEMAARYGGPCSNNGRIPYSVRDAAKSLKIGKDTATRAFEQLQDRGFIVEVKKGGFNLKTKHATEWRLTEFGCDVTDALPTRDYESWPQIQNSVPVAGPDGTCSGTVRYLQRDSEKRKAA
jgi:DNA-binding transcriptional MocR family regulator